MDENMTNLPEEEETDSMADIVVLTDEEGVEHTFELVDTLDLDDNEYVALVTTLDDTNDILEDDGNLVIMKIVSEENGEEILEIIEDDDEFEKVSDIFMERLSDLYEFDGDEEN